MPEAEQEIVSDSSADSLPVSALDKRGLGESIQGRSLEFAVFGAARLRHPGETEAPPVAVPVTVFREILVPDSEEFTPMEWITSVLSTEAFWR